MDDQTRKVLRRVCARYNTGIRKPFGVEGRIFRLVQDGDNDMIGVVFDDIKHRYYVEPIWELTPDGIMQAIVMGDTRYIMES